MKILCIGSRKGNTVTLTTFTAKNEIVKLILRIDSHG